jgi:hypothetical protein
MAPVLDRFSQGILLKYRTAASVPAFCQVEDRLPTPEEQGKDPAAVALGRRGGLKGGKSRAESMSADF